MSTLEYLCQLPSLAPLGWTLIHFLWEGAIIAFVLWIVLRAKHRSSPNLRYRMACGALLSALGAFVATFVLLSQPGPVASHQEGIILQASPPQVIVQLAPRGLDQSSANTPNNRSLGTPANTENNQPREALRSPAAMVAMALNSVARWAVPLWFAGVLLLALRLCLAWCRVQIWRFKTAPLLDAAILDSCSRLVEKLRVRQRVKVLLCHVTPGPVTLGWMRPVILLPVHVVTGLRPDEIEAILAHELAHIRRHDYLVNLLQSVIEVVLFYHPAIWWMSRQIREIREQCCDEMAAHACQNRLRVARALSSLAALEAAPQPALAATQGSLLTRIARLLGRTPADPLLSGRNAAWTLSLASIVLVALAILHSADLRAETPDEVANTKAAPRGIVLDENGAPSPQAGVLVYHMANFWGLGNAVVEEVRTDGTGHFACTKPLGFAVPNGSENTDRYLLLATQKGKGPGWARILGGTPEEREVTLRLTRPTSKSCQVVDGIGKPVAGATVWLYHDIRAFPTFFLRSDAGVSRATTDESGMATVSDLPGENYALAASKPGCEVCLEPKVEADGTLSFKLESAGTLAGRVTDPLGQPVKRATVRLVPKFGWNQNFLARTDEDGFYRVEKIWSHGTAPDRGNYRVGIEHPQFTMEEREVAFQPGQTIADFNLTVEPGTEIDGTLIDPNGKGSVAGGGILMKSKGGQQLVFSNARGEFHARVPGGEFTVMLTGAPGGHYVTGNGPWIIRGVASGGRMPLRCEIPGRLGKMGRVHGRVVDATGVPVARALITLLMPGPALQTSRGRTNRNNWVVCETREDGHFEIEEVPTGMKVALAGKGSARGEVDGLWTGTIKDAETDLGDSLVLQATNTAEVQVVDLDGRPRPNLGLHVSANFEGEIFSTENLTSDAAGVLRVSGVMPGMKYQIQKSNLVTGMPVRARRAEKISDNNLAEATTELLPAGATAGERRTVTISDKYVIRVEDPDGHVVPINSFKQFHVWILDDNGERTRWTNGPLNIVERRGEDVVVPRATLELGAPGDRIELLVETKDGRLVNAEGVLPDAASALIVAKSQ